MDDIKFTDPLFDQHDSHNHHVHEQRHTDLGLSLPRPPLSDNFKWDHGEVFPNRAYYIPKTSIFQHWAFNTEKAPGESSNTPSSSAGKAREEEQQEEEVHPMSTCTASSTSSIDKYLSNESEMITGDEDDDVEMDSFYDSLDVAAIPMLSNSHEKFITATPSDEEIRKALRSVQDFLSNNASTLLYPEKCSILKANLDYLSKLSADHGGISGEMSKVISEASQFLTHWSRDYTKAQTKIDFIMSQLLRADELEMSLESNKKRFLEVVALKTEQLNAIKANMSDSQSKAGISGKRKREIFEEGKTIKAELDELKKNVPQWEHEHTLAKKTQANIIAEWSRLRETFQNIEKDWNLVELD